MLDDSKTKTNKQCQKLLYSLSSYVKLLNILFCWLVSEPWPVLNVLAADLDLRPLAIIDLLCILN